MARCRGRIVKTIGDAVMASFVDPARALEAALDVQRDVMAFNRDHAAGLNANEHPNPDQHADGHSYEHEYPDSHAHRHRHADGATDSNPAELSKQHLRSDQDDEPIPRQPE